MELNELEELRECNELDVLYKLIETAEGLKKRTEQVLRDNKTAGVDVRHAMQDVKLLADIIRNQVQIRSGYFERANAKTKKKPDKTIEYKGCKIPNNTLEKAILDKNKSIEKEENLIKRTENLRKSKKKSKKDAANAS